MPIKYEIPSLPLNIDLENRAVLKQATLANRYLAELKGIAKTIPNEKILINTLALQEAKDSSEVENIVTTQDDLYRGDLKLENEKFSPATKEVHNYRSAILAGFEDLRQGRPLANNVIRHVHSVLLEADMGFRTLPGTKLKNGAGDIIYEPPQDATDIVRYMANLEKFVNTPALSDLDPLVKLAIIHHQFESIHPFTDGNGRTGRIVCILYLVANDLIQLPILYLSRYITQNKGDYYRLLQAVRDSDGAIEDWRAWIMFMLCGIEQTAKHTISIINGIKKLMQEYKERLRPALGKSYSHDLLNHLFSHPYTKIGYVVDALKVTRLTATKYLDAIVELGLLKKEHVGRTNYYINERLADLFVNHMEIDDQQRYV